MAVDVIQPKTPDWRADETLIEAVTLCDEVVSDIEQLVKDLLRLAARATIAKHEMLLLNPVEVAA